MGPKKKVDPAAQQLAMKVGLLSNKVKALQHQIVVQQQNADKSKTCQNNFRNRIVQLDEQFKNQKQRLYRTNWEKSNNQLNFKFVQASQQEQKKLSIRNMKHKHNQLLKKKEQKIQELKHKIQIMSAQFARMLKDTLTKMQDRIQMQQWDTQNNNPQLAKKFKDLSDSINYS